MTTIGVGSLLAAAVSALIARRYGIKSVYIVSILLLVLAECLILVGIYHGLHPVVRARP